MVTVVTPLAKVMVWTLLVPWVLMKAIASRSEQVPAAWPGLQSLPIPPVSTSTETARAGEAAQTKTMPSAARIRFFITKTPRAPANRYLA